MAEELSCTGCGAPSRPSDRFCSQCGLRDPTALATAQGTDPGSWVSLSTQAAAGQPGATADAPLAPGTVFARRYRIERLVGEGGMGRVYLAIDTTIDEPIALKFVSGANRFNPDILEQFKLELKLARRIRHRNVVASFHLGEAEGRTYITQEYIDAESLSALLWRRGSLDETEALGLMRQVLRGLKAAHDLGIVHRDIKAGNVLVNKDGIAFITDFGLALPVVQGAAFAPAGTPHYMAPELFDGEPATLSTDLYASGVLLFHVLTRGFPFPERSFFSLKHRDLEPAPIPAELAVSDPTRRLCDRLLARNPSDRPQQAVEVLEVFESLLALDALKIKTERPIALVADADEAVRVAARERLEREGYHVEATGTAQDTVNLAFSIDPSLVVLDSNVDGGQDIAVSRDAANSLAAEILPRHGGLGLCRLLQHDARLKRVPILVVTEEPHSGLKAAFMLMGAAEVIAKPFTSEEFAAGVERARRTAFARAAEA